MKLSIRNSGQLRLFACLLFFYINSTFGRIGLSTTSDGVVPTVSNNSYVSFNGQVGIQYSENAATTHEPLMSYTMTLWFRLDVSPNDIQRNMMLVTADPNGFQCFLDPYSSLKCQSDNAGSGDFVLDSQNIRLQNWYVLVLRSMQGQSLLQLREMYYDDILSQQQKVTYFPYQQLSNFTMSQVTLGINSDLQTMGIIGSIRNFKVFNYYLNDTVTKGAQYTYLYPYSNFLRIQIILSNMNDITNIASPSTSIKVGLQQSTGFSNQFDYTGVFQCWAPSESVIQSQMYSLQTFTPSLSFNTVTIPYSAVFTSLQAWVFRSQQISQSSDQILFSHPGILDLKILSASNKNLTVTNANRLIQGVLPFDRWIFIEVINTNQSLKVTTQFNTGDNSYSNQVFGSLLPGSVSQTLTIGQSFQGFILGMKYYKDLPPIQGQNPFTYSVDQNYWSIFYYMFTSQGAAGTSFQNLVQYSNVPNLVIKSGTVSLSGNMLVRQQSTDGVIPQQMNFDGVTCIDEQSKLYFPSAQSQANVQFRTGSTTIQNYTVEFWFRPNAKLVSGEAFLLAIQDSNYQLTTVVKLERDNTLSCYLSYSQNSSQLIKYFDFSSSSQTWNHISCTFNDIQQIGTLYNENQNYGYFSSTLQSLSLPVYSQIKIFLNSNPTQLNKGVSGAYYSELRFWTRSRSSQEIINYRFHQLDPTFTRGNLLIYFKLLSSAIDANGLPTEVDITSNYMQQQPTFKVSSDVNWVTQSDIEFCPVGTYKGESLGTSVEMVCYREGILQFELLVYKDPSLGYILTSQFSKYRNSMVQNKAGEIYDYQWSLTSVSSKNKSSNFTQSFNSQANSTTMILPFNGVTDSTIRYGISLSVQDKRNWQNTATATYSLKTLACANIFDNVTLTSYTLLDLNSTLGTQDIVFTYGFTDCPGYKLDKSQMVFYIDNDDVQLSSGDHNPTLQTFSLRSLYQSSLPLNKYFYLKITGLWRNSTSPADTVQYSLIYGCRFVSKLVLTLLPSSLSVLQGQTLVMNYKGTYTNMNKIGKSFTIVWSCPGTLNNYCQNQTGSQLQISSNTFADSGLAYFAPQQVTVTAYSNFIQGNGLSYSSTSVDIVWINVNSGASLTVFGSSVFTKQSNVTLQVATPGLQDAQIGINWVINPILTGNTCFPNSNNQKQFVMNTQCMTAGVTYNVTVSIILNSRKLLIWSNYTLVTIPKAPAGGTLTCSPIIAKAYQDTVTCSALNWRVTSGTARYQFFIMNQNGSLVAISPIQTNTTFSSTFPNTKQVQVKVIDAIYSFTYASFTLNVSTSLLGNQIQNQVQNQLNTASLKINIPTTDVIQSLQLIAPAIVSQAANQSFANAMTLQFSNLINFQVTNFSQTLSLDNKIFFAQVVIHVSSQLFPVATSDDKVIVLSNFQNALQMAATSDPAVLDALYADPANMISVMNQQSNILNWMTQANSNGEFINYTNSTNLQVKTGISNITLMMRQIFTNFEQYLSKKLSEGQSYNTSSPSLNFSVTKYSKYAGPTPIYTYRDNQNDNSFQYTFPLNTAIQPTDRQSLTVISFRQNPFIGSNYLNQTSVSTNAVYFAYRDANGNYLNGSNIPDHISITFPLSYSPYIFLPNATICGYVGTSDSQWGNKSCITTFNRDQSKVTCSCQHMSYYSIIDDFFMRPQTIPLVQQWFKNWISFIVILYVILSFIIGVIYTFNKDNQDFRYLHLHEHDELEGKQMEFDEQVSLVSLAFKRKVFFMDFSEEYTYLTLVRIYMMLLHPLFQLKYKQDPHIPRFFRFLLLQTRITISFGLSFFLLRDIQNPNSSADLAGVSNLLIFIFVGSLLYVPLPIMIYTAFRSRYFLLKVKSTSRNGSDYERQSNDPDYPGFQKDNIEDRVTNIEIDCSIPIKLLFIVNALPLAKIIEDNCQKIAYCSGDPTSVGQKLLELDSDQSIAPKDINIQHPLNADNKLQLASGPTSRLPILEVLEKRRPPQLEAEITQTSRLQQYIQSEDTKPRAQTPQQRRPIKINIDSNIYPEDYNSNNDNHQSPERNQGEIQSSRVDISKTILHDMNLDFENMCDDSAEQRMPKRNFNTQQKKRHGNPPLVINSQFEGGEPEITTQDFVGQPTINHFVSEPEHQAESEFSIDTNLFIDERKEMLEFSYFLNRILGGLFILILNGGIIIAVLYTFIKEGYYNVDNYYIWVLSFFGSQVVGLFITNPLCLFLIAAIVSKLCRFRKTILAKYFRESLYIFEDYQFVVKFAKTKIS